MQAIKDFSMHKSGFMTHFKQWLALLCCTLLLAACGGGGGNPGSTVGNNNSVSSRVASIVLVSSADTILSTGADGTEVTLSALVKDANNLVMEGQTVEWKSDSGNIVVISKTTDASGTAVVKLNVKGDTSLRTITVTATVGSIAATPKKIQVVAIVAPPNPTIAVSMFGANGQASNALSSATPLTARAIVRDANNKPVANALVSFTADNTLVAFTPSAGTTLSNADGIAEVTLRPASLSVSGAGAVTASVTINGVNILASGNFSVGATSITLGTMSLSPAHIGAYGSSVITIDVLAGGVKYTEQQLNIAFASNCVTAGKATLASTAPTSNGTAQVVYRDQGCGNTDQITASSTGIIKTSTATLAIDPPKAASIQFSAASPTDRSIVIRGQGGIGRTETASLTFKVFDTFGKPLAGQTVRFSTTNASITINKMSDSTDANGDVITTVNSGSVPTSFRVIATLDNGATTTSDSLVVTSGLPVQQAFSLAVSTANVEGWTADSGTLVPASVVSIMAADQAGNPVPDGLPVIFQTNVGSIGSASKGACNTANGGCSVDFRTQAPRIPVGANQPSTPCNTGSSGLVTNDSTRRGVATICASTTDGVNTLFAKTAIFMSGSTASKVYLQDAAGVYSQIKTEIDLGNVASTESKVITLEINDENNNPMPFGTKVEILNSVNVVGIGVSPATVANIFPHTAVVDVGTGTGIDDSSIRQGTVHKVSIGTAQSKPCQTELAGTFNVVITSPRGVGATYPFKVKFTCP